MREFPDAPALSGMTLMVLIERDVESCVAELRSKELGG
jgi:hypothetical protein